MHDRQPEFDVSQREAFRSLGVLDPPYHWSAFDVPLPEARRGQAKRLVMTIWSAHPASGAPAIHQDPRDGSLWYRVPRPQRTRGTETSHWERLQIALSSDIPIIGILKDGSARETHGRCSLDHLFDIVDARAEKGDDGALWLQLRPQAEVGAAVGQVDILELTVDEQSV